MVRANKVKDSVLLQERVDRIAEGAAMMTDTTFTRTFIDGTADLLPNFTLEKALYRNLSEIGAPSYTEEEIAFAEALKATYPASDWGLGTGARFHECQLHKIQRRNHSKPLYL